MICVSAGHHKHAPGACYGGYCEFEFTTEWADRVHYYLGEAGIRVPNGTLRNKAEFINKHNPNLAVEIHFNSAKVWRDLNKDGKIQDDEMVNVGEGSETLYFPSSPLGKQAAIMMQDKLGMLFPPDRGAKQGWYMRDPKRGANYFLQNTKCVSLILEPEFIDNTQVIIDNADVACNIIAATLLKIEKELFGGGD